KETTGTFLTISTPETDTPGRREVPAPAEAFAGRDRREFGAYVHVPFCATRCGYCDFNTYTSDELGDGATRSGYADSLRAEAALVAAAAETAGARPPTLDTGFFGGGTPTELRAGALARMLDGLDETFGIAAGAEITSAAIPDSPTPDGLDEMRAGGSDRQPAPKSPAKPIPIACRRKAWTRCVPGASTGFRWACSQRCHMCWRP